MLSNAGELTVNVADAELEPSAALILADFVAVTATVLTVNVAEAEPDATEIEAGTVAAEFDELNVTDTPPLPAFDVRVSVPVEEAPPTKDDDDSDTCETFCADATPKAAKSSKANPTFRIDLIKGAPDFCRRSALVFTSFGGRLAP